jgi:hypothetical protein
MPDGEEESTKKSERFSDQPDAKDVSPGQSMFYPATHFRRQQEVDNKRGVW